MEHLLQLGLARLAREHPRYHEALRRFHLERQPQADVARALGKTVGDVKNSVARGRKKLGAYLREEVASYCSAQPEYAEELAHLRSFLGDVA